MYFKITRECRCEVFWVPRSDGCWRRCQLCLFSSLLDIVYICELPYCAHMWSMCMFQWSLLCVKSCPAGDLLSWVLSPKVFGVIENFINCFSERRVWQEPSLPGHMPLAAGRKLGQWRACLTRVALMKLEFWVAWKREWNECWLALSMKVCVHALINLWKGFELMAVTLSHPPSLKSRPRLVLEAAQATHAFYWVLVLEPSWLAFFPGCPTHKW